MYEALTATDLDVHAYGVPDWDPDRVDELLDSLRDRYVDGTPTGPPRT